MFTELVVEITKLTAEIAMIEVGVVGKHAQSNLVCLPRPIRLLQLKHDLLTCTKLSIYAHSSIYQGDASCTIKNNVGRCKLQTSHSHHKINTSIDSIINALILFPFSTPPNFRKSVHE